MWRDLQTWHHQSKSKEEQNDACCTFAMTTVLLLVLSKYKLKFPVFFLKNHLLQKSTEEPFDRMETSSAPSWALCPTFKGLKLRYLFFGRERLGPSRLPWQPKLQVSFCLLFHLHLLSLV